MDIHFFSYKLIIRFWQTTRTYTRKPKPRKRTRVNIQQYSIMIDCRTLIRSFQLRVRATIIADHPRTIDLRWSENGSNIVFSNRTTTEKKKNIFFMYIRRERQNRMKYPTRFES